MTDTSVPPAPTSPPPPFAPGWAGAAMAINSIRQIPRPILLALVPEGHGSIVIDFRDLTYVWDTPIERFPTSPGVVQVGTHALDGDDRSLARGAVGLDPLLWMIGLHAFPGGLASWLRAGDKHRLKRWPDFDVLPHTPEQARVVKTLAKGLMTVEKLAKRAAVGDETARQVVNALSLMAALRRVESSTAAPMLPPSSADFQPIVKIGRHSTRRGG
ncbi:MAG: hypothetical protein JWP85_715 [Rhodoglobus sp.]|nr:hypothetical protein [Rhodoglobus sp.]